MEITTRNVRPRLNQVTLVEHLPRQDVFDRYRRTSGAVERTHWQIIYLKSQGKVVSEIAEVTGYSAAWIRRLIHRYNAVGPDAYVAHQPKDLTTSELRADHARKSEELDTARQAQMLMLTSPIPDHAELDIAAFQQTATEVGGDYYDFHAGESGLLTVAVGDATGHGAKAGIMVTATKSLFMALGHSPNLLWLVRRFTETIKSLNLRGLYMHLTLGRYFGGRLDLVVAGMPPVLVYREARGRVDSVVLKGMPLGSFPEFPYQRCTLALAEGDTVLLMSDGYLELLNPEGEMLEATRVCDAFEEAATGSAESIIADLRQAGEAWSRERPLNDDVTLVVLKRKAPPQST